MNDTQGEDDVIRMPARWWSIQWLSVRIVWGIAAGGVFAQSAGVNTDMGAVGGLAIGAVVFGALTAIAYSDRRRWAVKHADDQPELWNP